MRPPAKQKAVAKKAAAKKAVRKPAAKAKSGGSGVLPKGGGVTLAGRLLAVPATGAGTRGDATRLPPRT